MKSDLVFQYLNVNKRFKHLQRFIEELLNLHLEFIEINGHIVTSKKTAQLKQLKSKDNNKKKQYIHTSLLQTILEEKKPKIFSIDNNNRQLILIPIIVKNTIEGFLCLEEHENCSLKISQWQTIITLIKETLDSIINEELLQMFHFSGDKKTHQQKLINRVLNYIQENYSNHSLSLDEISQQANVSYYYLSHLFKKEKKISFSKYLTHLRIGVASRMLNDQSVTVSEVSRFCGFEDPGYFCKVFKRELGCPPVSYQKNSLHGRN